MPKKFQKIQENFVCEHCGFKVKGTGYTNHCPKCLWSKHMDINPGDRDNECEGMMEPISWDFSKGQYYVIQHCQRCGQEKRYKTRPEDNFDELLKLAQTVAKKQLF